MVVGVEERYGCCGCCCWGCCWFENVFVAELGGDWYRELDDDCFLTANWLSVGFEIGDTALLFELFVFAPSDVFKLFVFELLIDGEFAWDLFFKSIKFFAFNFFRKLFNFNQIPIIIRIIGCIVVLRRLIIIRRLLRLLRILIHSICWIIITKLSIRVVLRWLLLLTRWF